MCECLLAMSTCSFTSTFTYTYEQDTESTVNCMGTKEISLPSEYVSIVFESVNDSKRMLFLLLFQFRRNSSDSYKLYIIYEVRYWLALTAKFK